MGIPSGYTSAQVVQAVPGSIVGGGDIVSFTPTFTNLTVGNGTTEAYYQRIQNIVGVWVAVTFGSTSSISGAVTFNLPFARVTSSLIRLPLGNVLIRDSGTQNYVGDVFPTDSSASVIQLRYYSVAGSNVIQSQLSSSAPMTWTTGDEISFNFFYRIA